LRDPDVGAFVVSVLGGGLCNSPTFATPRGGLATTFSLLQHCGDFDGCAGFCSVTSATTRGDAVVEVVTLEAGVLSLVWTDFLGASKALPGLRPEAGNAGSLLHKEPENVAL
jgi:hypothetical protein